MWIEINCAHTFSHSPPITTREAGRRRSLFSLSFLNPTDWACLPAQRCERLSFIQHRAVCLCVFLYMTINPTHTVYLPGTREVMYRILFVTGGARWSPSPLSPAWIYARRHISQAFPCGRSRGVWQISSPGRVGVNEHFNHLAECQSLLGVITSAFLRDKSGKSAAEQGKHSSVAVESHLMPLFWLSGNQIFIFVWLTWIWYHRHSSVYVWLSPLSAVKKCHKLRL